ncbi:MAG TPA: TonB-dependent receptor [Rhodanobacteraceae bacterium]
MNHKMKRLSLAVRIGLTAGLAAAAGLAQAQQSPQQAQPDSSTQKTKPKTLQEVVVTGSLIKRVDLETASPVVKIDRQDIVNSGKPTLGDVVQQLPSIRGNATNPQNNTNGGGVASPLTEGGDGASRISLRGLGTGRTLVLIDGQRMLNADVNLIPQAMVQRVDVLATGASTVYGSDAVGGVVNFILRKDYNGAEVSVSDGVSSHGDGQRRGLSIIMGHSTDKFSIAGGIDYNKYDAVPATRRNFSKEQLYLYGGVVTVAGSSSIPTGRMQIPPSLAGRFNCPPFNQVTLASGDGTSLNDYRCRTQDDTFNYAAYNYIQVSQQRTDGFFLGSYNLTDNITAFLDAFYNHTESAGQDASSPVGTGDGLIIPSTAPFNPFGVTFSQNVLPNDPNSGYTFQTRLTGVGTRLHPYITSTGQVITGLRGRVGQSSWNWDVTLDYGHTARLQRDENELSIPALQSAIDNGVNIFDQAANGAALAAGAVTANYHKYESMRQIQAQANGELWDMPAGPVQLAVGALYRKQTMNYTVDPFAVIDPVTTTCGILQEACGSPGRGSDNVKEVFAETLIPLLSNVPFAHSLNVDLGVRTTKYNTMSGSTTNGKIAIEWRPIEDLLVRGTVQQVFRAPDLDQLFDGRSLVQPNLNDPCIGLTAAELAQHSAACQYVPPGWKGNDIAQVNTFYSGSEVVGRSLKPEHGKSIDLGFVYGPSWAPGLNASLDFWHIYLYDTLVPISGPNVVNACFANNASPFCGFIHRQDTSTRNPGQVFIIDTPVVNLGSLSTSGVDLTLNYKIPHFDWGSFNPGDFKLGFNTSYTATYKNDATPGQPGDVTTEYAGTLTTQFGNISRWRAAVTLNWNRDNWDAQWQTRYISPVTALNADALTNANLAMASATYSSLQVGYAVPSIHTRFDIGADNIFNRQPPLWYQNGQVNTDTATYDTMGRYYWARATLKF